MIAAGTSRPHAGWRCVRLLRALLYERRAEIAPDDGTAWFWRQIISGWVRCYAVSEGERGMLEWFYSGEQPPTGPLARRFHGGGVEGGVVNGESAP